jgi:putative ABC transport system substrate-binding protein
VLAGRAQQPLPTIGFMGANASVFTLGWIEGRTIAIEYRWSEGRPERNAEIAAEFVRLKVNVMSPLEAPSPH